MSESREYYNLILFYGFVLVAEWALSIMVVDSFPFGIGFIVVTPAISALLITYLREGMQGLRSFVSRIFRLYKPIWFVYASLIPITIHVFALLLAILMGETIQFSVEVFLIYIPITLILASGEEIGWQGYMVPIIRKMYSPLITTLIFGVLHAVFHLPMYLLPLPLELRQASPFWLFTILAISFSYFRVVLLDETAGNIPVAIVYHAAINTSVLLLNGVGRETMAWLIPIFWMMAFFTYYGYRRIRSGTVLKSI